MLSQEELKKEILSQEKNIKKIISSTKRVSKFALYVDHNGQYQIKASKRNLIPEVALNNYTAHYTATYSIDSTNTKKRPSANKITKNLLKHLFEVMEKTTWYF